VSKSRRVRFELTLRIIDLNNVPLVSGTSFIKWHLPSSTAAEHRGRTNKCPIRDHRVAYEYEKQVHVRLTVGKDGMLQECSVELEVLQEYNASGRGERIRLGAVKLNLAEYVEASEALPSSPGPAPSELHEEGVVRRYLMQESKINSTLKVGIHMRHIEGTRDYYAPPLRTAPVFGGIAGIISHSEPVAGGGNILADTDGPDAVHNFISSNKEVGEMLDMYRRSLAAGWSSQPGELQADECIEDIFAGGDGWGKHGRPQLTHSQ
ncbi:N-terminal C2 in EEIG1 and EHBP1 proteins-domain-containing protein, partial [Neohortaea acidophila]